jgi:hypothetical protein
MVPWYRVIFAIIQNLSSFYSPAGRISALSIERPILFPQMAEIEYQSGVLSRIHKDLLQNGERITLRRNTEIRREIKSLGFIRAGRLFPSGGGSNISFPRKRSYQWNRGHPVPQKTRKSNHERVKWRIPRQPVTIYNVTG